MAKKIRSSEVVQNDLFGPLGKSASEAQNKVDLLEASLEMVKQTAKQLSGKLDGLNPKDTASIRETNKLTGQANVIAKERTAINKRLIKEQTKLTATTKKNRKELAATRVENQRLNKLAKETAELKNKETGAYRKAAIQLARTSKALKDAVAGGKATKREIKRLKNEFESASVKIRKADAAARDFRRNVGNYPKALGGARRALGALGLAFGGIALARNAIKTVAGFEQAIANIKSVTNASEAEMAAFEKKAKEVGETTQFTASQVAGLQFELAKLGFDPQDIINSTEPISNFAASVGVDLPEAASLAGSALRAFGLESKDMDRVVSVLGVATAKTALDFQKLQTGLSTVAPVAAAFGFSIEGTTALLGQLANAGFDASSAATATRNILLNLADANGDLAKELGRPVESADDLAAALLELQERGIDLSSALELTDKRSVAAFETFLAGAGSLSTLKGELTNVNDELARMAEDRMNTLQGDLKLLTSRWEIWLLGVNETTGGLSRARKAVKFLTTNLKTILRVIKLVAVAWAGWKLGRFASNVIESTKGLKSMARSMRSVTTATNSAATAQKSLNAAQKSNAIGLLVSVLATLVALLWDYSNAASSATVSQEGLNEAIAQGEEIISERNKSLQDEITLIQLRGEEAVKAAENEKKSAKEIAEIKNKSIKDQRALLAKEIAITDKTIATLEAKILKEVKGGPAFRTISNTQLEGLREQVKLLKESRNELDIQSRQTGLQSTKKGGKIGGSAGSTGGGGSGDQLTRLKELKAQLKENRGAVEKLADENTSADDSRVLSLNSIGVGLEIQIKHIEDLINLKKKEAKAGETKEQKRDRREKIELLEAEIRAQEKIATIDPTRKTDDPQFIDEAKTLRDLEIEKREIRLKFLDLKIQDTIAALIESDDLEGKEREKLEQQKLERQTLLNEINVKKLDADLEENRKEQLDLENEFLDRKLNGRKSSDKELLAAEKKFQRLLKSGKLDTDAKLDAAEDERNAVRVGRKKDSNKEFLAAEKQFQKDLIDLQIEGLKLKQQPLDPDSEGFKKIENEIFNLQSEKQDLDKKDKKSEEELQESFNRRTQTIDLFTQYFIQQSDRRIKKIEEEIKAAERQAGVLAGLAASGNITAQQSLAQQDQIIAESNKRKEEEEKRKQRILLVSAVLQAYNSELAAGSTASEAFSKAITSTVVLERFVSALPTFFDGIEDTGSQGQGVDGRGGFHAILHPNERVLTAKQNAKTAGYSNDEIASIVEDQRAGSYIVDRGFMDGTSGGTKANDALVNEMKGVKKAIKEIPENNIELGRITQGYLLLNQTKKQGNRRTTDSFKVKP